MNTTNRIESIRSLSQILSTSFLRKAVRRNDVSILKARLRKHSHKVFCTHYEKYNQLIAALYNVLKEDYCNEYVYKNTVVNELFLRQHRLSTITLLNEFGINRSVADLILINGEPTLYEIKTALDNTERLQSQIEDYKKAISKVYLVVSSKSIASILEKYSSTKIGIYEFTQAHELLKHQKAEEDNSQLDHTTLFKLLRKEEYIKVTKERFGFVPEVPNTMLFRECLSLVLSVEVTELQKMVFNQLKERKLKCPDQLQSESTPYELKHLCYTLNFSEADYNNLYRLLDSNL